MLRTLFVALALISLHLPAQAQDTSTVERIHPGWGMVLGGGLGLIGSQTGIHRTRDANERFLYYSFQALSVMAMGYGLHKVYGVEKFDAFQEELNLLDLPPETKQSLMEMYLRSTQRAEKIRDKARGLSLLATGILLFAQSTTEEHAKTKTALGVASGLCLLGGLTFTF